MEPHHMDTVYIKTMSADIRSAALCILKSLTTLAYIQPLVISRGDAATQLLILTLMISLLSVSMAGCGHGLDTHIWQIYSAFGVFTTEPHVDLWFFTSSISFRHCLALGASAQVCSDILSACR
jgi:hypothetical protein